jgi:hypothetical protein
MLHSDIDLHKRTIAIATVTPDGQAVQDRQLPTTRAAVRAYFAALPGPHRAVVESTSHWYWLRDLLTGAGVDLRLGHSKYIKASSHAKVKTDAVDAATLAQLLRSGLIPEAHMVCAEWREARDLLRAPAARHAASPVQERARRAAHAVRRPGEAAGRRPEPAADPDARRAAARLDPQRRPARRLRHRARGRRHRALPSARDFVSYCRLVPGAGNSGGKTKHKRTKDGNRYLKIAFTHAAIRAIQYYPEIRALYRALARRKPPAVARAIVAKELARIVFYVLSKQEAFNGTFKGRPLSRTKQPRWPRLVSPPLPLESPARGRAAPPI